MASDSYREYLRSPHWRAFRAEQLATRRVCEACHRAPAVQLHHLRYRDHNGKSILGREVAGDVMPVCDKCHRMLEAAKREAPLSGDVPPWVTVLQQRLPPQSKEHYAKRCPRREREHRPRGELGLRQRGPGRWRPATKKEQRLKQEQEKRRAADKRTA